MNQAAKNQFDAICLTLLFKHGPDFKKHYLEMADYWAGPLYEGNYYVYKHSLRKKTNKKLIELLSKLRGVKFHPVYTRDFMQGVIDSGCKPARSCLFPVVQFYGNHRLREFLESDVHGFHIRFDESKKRNRTRTLPFLFLPCEGELDLYFAGVLTGSRPVTRNGELLFEVSSRCSGNLRRLNIVFHQENEKIYLSPFYILLFSGEIPENIYFDFQNRINDCSIRELKQGCLDSFFHWRVLRGYEHWEVNDFPLLQSPVVYHRYFDLGTREFDLKMEGERKDFVDRRLAKRCERWYNTNKEFSTR